MAAFNCGFSAEHQGRAPVLYSCLSFGRVAGGVIFGYVWDHWGAAPTYSLTSFFALIGTVVVLRRLRGI